MGRDGGICRVQRNSRERTSVDVGWGEDPNHERRRVDQSARQYAAVLMRVPRSRRSQTLLVQCVCMGFISEAFTSHFVVSGLPFSRSGGLER